jgi:hypothetical protein
MIGQSGNSTKIEGSLTIKQRLLQAAVTKQISAECVEHLLRSVDFHDGLRGFVRRIRNLNRILSIKIDDWTLFREFPALGAWQEFITSLLVDPRGFSQSMGLSGREADDFLFENGSDPLHGDATNDHGLEALLWVRSPAAGILVDSPNVGESDLNTKFVLLQAQVVMAQTSILDDHYRKLGKSSHHAPDPSILQSVSREAREAKRFARERWLHSLGLLPNVLDRRHYKEKLEAVLNQIETSSPVKVVGPSKEGLPERFGNAISRIAHFLDRGLKPGSYEKREYKQVPTIELSRATVNVTGGEDPRSTDSEIITRLKGSKDQRDALEDADEAPDDHLPRRDFILVHGSSETATWIRAAQERANQLLPRTYQEPHPAEFLDLTRAISGQWQQLGYEGNGIELVAWTQCLFWLSCTPEQATNVMVGLNETPAPDSDFYIRFSQINGQRLACPPVIRIRANEPPYRKQLVEIPDERYRKKYFELEDGGGLCQSIRHFLQQRQSGGEDCLRDHVLRRQSTKLFTRAPSWYRDQLRGFIKRLRQEDRVTVSGLGRVLFQRYIEQGDIVAASQLTCRDHDLQKSRKWYATYSIEHLRKIYAATNRRVFSELKSLGWRPPDQPGKLARDNDSVGSRRCVKENSLEAYVRNLKIIVRRNRALKSLRFKRIEFSEKHNAFTILAIWTVEICVGMRGIRHPYFHASEYDQDTGYGTFTDKDPGEGIKSRPFRLPMLARSILKSYDSYLTKLPKFGLPAQSRALPCYFLRIEGSDLAAVEVRPATINAILGSFFKFAPNWGRRFIKTTATEFGICPAYTDIYCGHFQRGEESFNPYSSIDPLEYFNSMDEFLTGRLERLGFEPLDLEPCL